MNAQDRARVRSLIDAGAWTDARKVLQDLELPHDVEWLALSAEVEAGVGNLHRAAELWDKVLELRPDNPAALYNASIVLSDLDRHDEAITALEALIEIEGESASVLNDLSYEYLEAEHYVPAYLAAVRADQLASDETQRCLARLNAATALANMGRRSEALARIDSMLRECTGACGEQQAAQELKQSLDPRHPRRSTTRTILTNDQRTSVAARHPEP